MSILECGIHIPNLLTNYPTKFHEKLHKYYSQTYLPNFHDIIII